MKQVNLIQIHGTPGVGKSLLAIRLFSELSMMGFNTHYVQEWIKDMANRKYKITPPDQLGIIGNQAFLINTAVQAGYDYVTCCSSTSLCAFYANYYSDNAFPGLIEISKQWCDYVGKHYNVVMSDYFVCLDKEKYIERFRQEGRYESLEQVLKMQDSMVAWYNKHFPETQIIKEANPNLILEQLGINHGTFIQKI